MRFYSFRYLVCILGNSYEKFDPVISRKSHVSKLRNYGKNVKKSVKIEIPLSLKVTQQERKINRRGEQRNDSIWKKRCSTTTVLFCQNSQIHLSMSTVYQSKLYIVLLHDIYFKCWDFFPESNIIPPTTFCCTFKTIVVCVETGKLSEKSYQK